MDWIKYKLLKWAVVLYCWPFRNGRVVVTFDLDRPFTLITGRSAAPLDHEKAIDDHFKEFNRE